MPSQSVTIQDLLPASVAEVLETMFFTVVEPAMPEPGTQLSVCVEVRFHGSPSGVFRVWLTAAGNRGLAADFLGTAADELTPEQELGTALELGNMICGSVVSRLETDRAFELAGPEPCVPAPEPPSDAQWFTSLDRGMFAVLCELAG